MFKRRKLLEKIKSSKAMREAESLEYNDMGRAIIEVGIKNADDFFHPCSYKSYDLVSQNVVECVEMFEKQIPSKDEIAIDVYTEEPTTNFDKTRIRSAIKRHYSEKTVNLKKKMRRNLIFGTIFSLLGVGLVALECLLWNIWGHMFVDTLLSIIAWVFLWDGFELLVIELPPLKIEQEKNLRLLSSKVHVRQYSATIKRKYLIDPEEED